MATSMCETRQRVSEWESDLRGRGGVEVAMWSGADTGTEG